MKTLAILIRLPGLLFVSTVPASASPMEPSPTALHMHQLPLSKVVLYSSGVGIFSTMARYRERAASIFDSRSIKSMTCSKASACRTPAAGAFRR